MTISSPNSRLSLVARFDTVVFNPETQVLEVWRYKSGLYQGEHEVVMSVPSRLIKDDDDLFQVSSLIGKVASVYGLSKEYDLPSPWWGYRFR